MSVDYYHVSLLSASKLSKDFTGDPSSATTSAVFYNNCTLARKYPIDTLFFPSEIFFLWWTNVVMESETAQIVTNTLLSL